MNNNAIFKLITDPVLGTEQSPYHVMMRTLMQIDKKYSGSIDLLGEELDPAMGRTLRQHIFNQFMAEARTQIDCAKALEDGILSSVRQAVAGQPDALAEALSFLRSFVATQLYYPRPRPHTPSELSQLKSDAERITLAERLKHSNTSDVAHYYRALLGNTLHSCHRITRLYTGHYLLHLADQLEKN